jgi:hypothetical protein
MALLAGVMPSRLLDPALSGARQTSSGKPRKNPWMTHAYTSVANHEIPDVQNIGFPPAQIVESRH